MGETASVIFSKSKVSIIQQRLPFCKELKKKFKPNL
jgi:hypothetical protein